MARIKAAQGESLMSATHKAAGQKSDEKHERRGIPHGAKVEDGELASVNVTLRHTKNIGNYESMVFGVSVTRPCHPDQIDGAVRLTQGIVESHLERIIREWMPSEE